MVIIGIDPGSTGAVATYDGLTVQVFDMPSAKILKGKSAKTRLDFGALYDRIRVLAMLDPALCVFEENGGVMNQSADASFQFGRATGAAEMAVIGHGIPITYAPPATWKAAFRIPAKGTSAERKALSRLTASNLLPNARHLWPRVQDAGRAEAALLAVYGFRMLSNGAKVQS